MCRLTPSLIVALLVAIAVGNAHGQGDPELVKATTALQKAILKTIQQSEGSIACILVSRTERYKSNHTVPGKLGAFDPKFLQFPPDVKSDSDKKRYSDKHDLADANYVPSSYGSGVVIDANGLVLTNYHVVQDAVLIYVRLPGGKGSYADIHAADARSDLAVLKLLGDVGSPKAISFGDADKVDRGQFVLTLSNPYAAGFRDGQPSASWGIVSNIRRRAQRLYKEDERIKPLQFHSTLLQTDARLNLGCSGGALLNLNGEMVGLLSSIAAIQGGETPGGFAIPINSGMRKIVDQLKLGEEVEYGYLGIGFNPPADGQTGVTLTVVQSGSPAHGKLQKDDVIISIDGRAIREPEDIYLGIGAALAGSKIRVRLQRGRDEHFVDITLAKLHVPDKSIASSLGRRTYYRGLRVDWTSLIPQERRAGASMIPPGVLITEVQPNGPAERAKLRTGDVITHVDGQEVFTPAAFYQAVPALGQVELTLFTYPTDPPRKVMLRP